MRQHNLFSAGVLLPILFSKGCNLAAALPSMEDPVTTALCHVA